MQISILEQSVTLPIELKIVGSPFHLPPPPEVAAAARQGKVWHLLSWVDEATNTFGLYRKHQGICVSRAKVSAASISYITPAKGLGWVALEVKSEDPAGMFSLLEVPIYSEAAVKWLLERKAVFERLLGQPVAVNDCGSDY